MPLSSRVLLSRLLLLIIAGSTGAFSSRQGGKKPPFLNDVLCPAGRQWRWHGRRRRRWDGGDDSRYEFRLFVATTNFHENSRGLTLSLPFSSRNSSLDVPVVSSSFEIARISVCAQHPPVNFTLFAHSPTSVKIRYRALFVRLFHARFLVNQAGEFALHIFDTEMF